MLDKAKTMNTKEWLLEMDRRREELAAFVAAHPELDEARTTVARWETLSAATRDDAPVGHVRCEGWDGDHECQEIAPYMPLPGDWIEKYGTCGCETHFYCPQHVHQAGNEGRCAECSR